MNLKDWIKKLNGKSQPTRSKVVLTGDFRALLVARLGDVVFIECERSFSNSEIERAAVMLKDALKPAGVRAVILPYGMCVTRVEPDTKITKKAEA